MRRRTSREVALSRNLPRLQVMDQGENFPLMKPDRRDESRVEFWKRLEANKRKPVARQARPRLLDPLPVRRGKEPNNLAGKNSALSRGNTESAPLPTAPPAIVAGCGPRFGNESAKRPGASDSSTPATVPSGAAGQFSLQQDEKGSQGLTVGSRAHQTQTAL